ncbi:hypothetical protein IBF23_09360 [Francisella tularensis]|uniref:hypothetical protein n=1 Tax=Francisella tularensis TaxID=263 RepID=UPI001C0F195E|nr:hypothetical protein [Francisella tularensis]MBK2142943.1 hypothetical protein [Francisella tularensis]
MHEVVGIVFLIATPTTEIDTYAIVGRYVYEKETAYKIVLIIKDGGVANFDKEALKF